MENEPALRILMLEDSSEDAMLIQRELRKDNLSFVAELVDTESEFRTAIKKFRPDVVLSDHGLPGFNSREALKICLKERSLTPFILVTGTVSDDYAVACLRDGADDYILKSNLVRLPSAIRSAVKKRKLEKLKRDSRHTLRRQNDELLKINQELDALVYSVSHNLRGPLASILGLLNLANLETNLEAIRPMLSMMRVSVAHLDETIQEILDYSRNARNEIHLGEIDWNQIINHALKKVEHLDPEQIVQKHTDLVTYIPAFSDGNRIAIILTNILSNAYSFRKAGRAPSVSIQVIVSQTECRIAVEDNGTGIPPDILPNVYSMFYRGSENSRGAGLGLYITREIVNKLGGKINIYSMRDIGTRVIVQLPNVTSCELNTQH